MTTAAEIEREINEKYVKWTREPFNLIKLPDNIIKMFEEAVFIVPPDKHLLMVNDIRAILSKTPDQLSNVEVGHVVNIIMAAPPFNIYKDLDEYLTKGGIYSILKVQYNKMVKDKEALLATEGKAKMRLINR